MKRIIYICALVFSFNALAQSVITKNLGDFSTLKVYNGIELELIQSNEPVSYTHLTLPTICSV